MRGRTPELVNLERKAIEELKEFWITALYLVVFLMRFPRTHLAVRSALTFLVMPQPHLNQDSF